MSTPYTPHTPEPYRQECDGDEVYVTGSDGLERVCTMATAGRGQRLRDSARIVACVNFCQGVPNDQMHPGRLALLINKATDQQAEIARLEAGKAKLREALQDLVSCFWEGRPKRNVKRDFHVMNLHACATKTLLQDKEDA